MLRSGDTSAVAGLLRTLRLCMSIWASGFLLSDAEAKSFVAENRLRLPVDGHANAIAWSPDGQYLAALDRIAHNLVVWDTRMGRLLFKVPDLAGVARGLSFTHDGKFIVSNDGNSVTFPFAVWDARTGARVRSVQRPTSTTPREQLVFGPDILLANASDQTVISIPLNGSKVTAYEIGSWSVSYSIPYLENVISKVPAIMSAALSLNGDQLAIGDLSGRVQLWKIENRTARKIADFQAEENRAGKPGPLDVSALAASYRSGYVTALAFSPKGEFLAAGSTIASATAREQLRLWDTRSLSAIRAYDTGTQHQKVANISFSAEGRYIATVGDPMPIRIWDSESSTLLRSIPKEGRLFDVVAFSPDGRKLAYGGEGVIYIISVQ